MLHCNYRLTVLLCPAQVQDEAFSLEPGDALTIGAAVPHSWRTAEGVAGARILWVLAPALPDARRAVR